MDFAKKWGFKHRRVTPEWPRANGKPKSSKIIVMKQKTFKNNSDQKINFFAIENRKRIFFFKKYKKY
jgi:hypothetical protein